MLRHSRREDGELDLDGLDMSRIYSQIKFKSLEFVVIYSLDREAQPLSETPWSFQNCIMQSAITYPSRC